MKEIPVYVFTGLLESGKTRFIRDLLHDPNFTDGERTLLLQCEQGEEELSEGELRDCAAVAAAIETPEDFTPQALTALSDAHHPDRVMLELNGMWKLDVLAGLPENWLVYQIVTSINAATYELYSQNLGPMMFDHIASADLVVFNRCTPALKEFLRSKNLRAMNPKASMLLDSEDGTTEDYADDMPLPFDVDADEITLEDTDFGLWYVDAQADPQKYDGKTVTMTAMVYQGDNVPPDSFVLGRFGMVCCADDISFLGLICRCGDAAKYQTRDWVRVSASVTVEALPEYRGEGPVLHALSVSPAAPPQEELVYFN